MFRVSFPLISDQALSALIGIQCLLINQNYVVHKFQEQDSTVFTPEIYIYIIHIYRIYLYFAEKYVALLLPSLKKNMWHNRIGFLESLVDTPSQTTHFPLMLPMFSLTYRRLKILISYIPTYLAVLYFLAGTTKLFCITSQGIS